MRRCKLDEHCALSAARRRREGKWWKVGRTLTRRCNVCSRCMTLWDYLFLQPKVGITWSYLYHVNPSRCWVLNELIISHWSLTRCPSRFLGLPLNDRTIHRPLLRGLDDQAPKHIPLLGINSVVPHYRDNSNMLNNSSMLGFGINYMKRQQMSWYLATII